MVGKECVVGGRWWGSVMMVVLGGERAPDRKTTGRQTWPIFAPPRQFQFFLLRRTPARTDEPEMQCNTLGGAVGHGTSAKRARDRRTPVVSMSCVGGQPGHQRASSHPRRPPFPASKTSSTIGVAGGQRGRKSMAFNASTGLWGAIPPCQAACLQTRAWQSRNHLAQGEMASEDNRL